MTLRRQMAALGLAAIALLIGCQAPRAAGENSSRKYRLETVNCPEGGTASEDKRLAMLDTSTGAAWVYSHNGAGQWAFLQAKSTISTSGEGHFVFVNAPDSFPWAGTVLFDEDSGRMWGLICVSSGAPELASLQRMAPIDNGPKGSKQ